MSKEKLYFVINKPFKVLSQFTPEHDKKHLGDFYNFPKDVYSLGRLDEDSEGLLVLTNDKYLKTQAMNSDIKVQKTYWVFVEGKVTDEAIEKLRRGVDIALKGQHYHTQAAEVERLVNPIIFDREPTILKPGEWLEIKISEGKYRQVRKMTAAVGHPTLRLVRVGYGDLTLGDLKPGACVMLSKKVIYKKILGI